MGLSVASFKSYVSHQHHWQRRWKHTNSLTFMVLQVFGLCNNSNYTEMIGSIAYCTLVNPVSLLEMMHAQAMSSDDGEMGFDEGLAGQRSDA